MPRVSRDGSPRTRDEASKDRGKAGIELLDDLLWSTTFFVRVGASEVEVELVRGSLGQEVGTAGERFQVKELIFDEAMDGFHIGLVSVGSGRDALMLRTEGSDGGGESELGNRRTAIRR